MAILNESRTGVVMLDSDGNIEFVNYALETFLQKTKEELLQQHWETVFPVATADKQKITHFAAPSLYI